MLKVSRDDFLMRMPGIGGTGVVTVSQILQMAALLDGKHSYGLDQTGLAQKGGPVVCDVRIARDPIEGSNKASAGAADLLLGFDVLGAANPRNLLVADSARTVAVVNTHAAPTAAMVTDTGVKFPALERNVAAIGAATRAEENVYVDAEALSEALFGDHMPTNTVLIGAAYQAGCLPLSADALRAGDPAQRRGGREEPRGVRLGPRGAWRRRRRCAWCWRGRRPRRPRRCRARRWRSSRRRARSGSCGGCWRCALSS